MMFEGLKRRMRDHPTVGEDRPRSHSDTNENFPWLEGYEKAPVTGSLPGGVRFTFLAGHGGVEVRL